MLRPQIFEKPLKMIKLHEEEKDRFCLGVSVKLSTNNIRRQQYYVRKDLLIAENRHLQ
jgi:hypothetical protein